MAASGVVSKRAFAQLPLEAEASRVTLDPKGKEVELSGDVKAESPPFFFRSQSLTMKTTPHGVEVAGEGTLSFCPCLGTPLAVHFHDAIVAPPGDLILFRPSLELFGVPVMWLPAFWLRSRARLGLLPPDLAWRGGDGFYIGGGVHLPLAAPAKAELSDEAVGLELRAGGYVEGGVRTEADLRTHGTDTHFVWDRLRRDGALLDSRGALDERLRWNIDTVRGQRMVDAVSDLGVAALRKERSFVEGSTGGPFEVSVGATSIGNRGTSTALETAGPIAGIAFSASPTRSSLVDFRAQGGVMRDADTARALFVSELHSSRSARIGAVRLDFSERGYLSTLSGDEEASVSALGVVRAEATLPLERSYATRGEGTRSGERVRHRIEPFVSASVLGSSGSDDLGFGRGYELASGAHWTAVGGTRSDLGKWGARTGFSFETSVGAHGIREHQELLVSAKTSLNFEAAGARVEYAASETSAYVDGRARLGKRDGLSVIFSGQVKRGTFLDGVRLLSDLSTASPTFVRREAATVGADVRMPIGFLTTTGGLDYDLQNEELLRATFGLLFKDPCRCLSVRVLASERVGREGFDARVLFDVTPRP